MGGDEHRRNVQGQLRAFLREGWMLKAVADPQADLHPCKPACVEGKKAPKERTWRKGRAERTGKGAHNCFYGLYIFKHDLTFFE